MKFSKFGRISLALVASVALAFGTQSCTYDYTEAYIIVTGSQYNQIATYKENDDTGQLAPIPGNPLSSGGSDPIRALLLPGGRYVYVLNEGTPKADAAGNLHWTGGNISLFSIGGDGTLSYQLSYPSQGLGSVRVALGSTSSYLYVLDQYQPGSAADVASASPVPTATNVCRNPTNGLYYPAGDITVFSIDAATGRLFLVQNQQQQNAQGTPLNYFPLGCGPIDFHLGSGYLYTAETSDPNTGNNQVIYAYQANATNGQLIQVPGGSQPVTGATNISVIGSSQSGSWIYVLDAGTNTIYTYTAGSNGLLSAITGGAVPNFTGASGMDALTTDSNSKYLYIANTQSAALGQAGSYISAFTVTPGTGVLQTMAGQPFPTGSTPVCIFEDPSHQYVYTADAGSSVVTGKLIDPNTGILTDMRKGSTFSTVGTPTWCLYSQNTD